jgi:gamma-butyrobetaine dioxygenase
VSSARDPAPRPEPPWVFDDEAGPARLHDALARHGYARCLAPGLVAAAERDPWAVARRLHGDVQLVEAHPIHPVPHGRSFASTSGVTPFHTDSQSRRGVPPRWQIMLCARPAASGGETLLEDTWPLLERIEAQDPPLYQALLGRVRRMRFVFGDVVGPTVSLRGGGVVFTHSPMAVGDDIERGLAAWIERAPRIEIRVEADEVMVVDNHRMLHGRRAFEDVQRRFLRILVWTGAPAAAPKRQHDARAGGAIARGAAEARARGLPRCIRPGGSGSGPQAADRARDAARRIARRAGAAPWGAGGRAVPLAGCGAAGSGRRPGRVGWVSAGGHCKANPEVQSVQTRAAKDRREL